MTMPTLLMQRAHDEAVGDDLPELARQASPADASPPSTSWRSWPSTTRALATATRVPCCAVRGFTRVTSWSGAGPGTMRRRPASALLDGRRRTLTRRRWRRRTSGSSGSRPTWRSTSWRWISREKLTRSWRCLPRARPTTTRGHDRPGVQAEAVIEACFAELEPLVGTAAACRGSGRSRATHYRRMPPPLLGPSAAALDAGQRPVRGGVRRAFGGAALAPVL